MADPIPTPTPTTEPVPSTPQKKGLLKKADQEKIRKSEKVVTAASKPEYASKLGTDGGMDMTIVGRLSTNCGLARQKSGMVVDKKTDKLEASQTEDELETKLLKLVRYAQKGARRKLKPVQHKDFFIGEPIEKNQKLLIAASVAIEEKLKTLTLPGVAADTGTKLKTAREALTGGDDTQTSEQSAASTKAVELSKLMKQINHDRVEIQLAADAVWPYEEPLNGPIRVEFQMQPDKPFVARVENDDDETTPT